MRLALSIAVIGVLAGGVSQAQQVISAHAGVVHYVEGRVFVDGQLVEKKFAQFPDLREGGELRTEAGRAEVLLTPGALLRIAENSSVRMVSRQLSDTRVEVLSGSAMVECEQLLKDNAITVLYQGKEIHLEKQGLYRLDTEPPEFKVYAGKATIQSGSDQIALTAGKVANLDGLPVAEKFDTKQTDSFYAWNGMRSGYIASANVSAARSLVSGGTPWTSSGWLYDPWYGAFTFVPFAGMFYNPFGWGFWSPTMVAFAPPPVFRGFTPGIGSGGRQTVGGSPSSGSGITRIAAPAAGLRPGVASLGGGSRTGFSGSSYGGSGVVGGGRSSGGFSGGARSGGGFSGGGHAGGGGGGHGR